MFKSIASSSIHRSVRYLFTHDFCGSIFSTFVEIHEIINCILFRHPLAKWSSTPICRIISSHAHRFQYPLLPIPYGTSSYIGLHQSVSTVFWQFIYIAIRKNLIFHRTTSNAVSQTTYIMWEVKNCSQNCPVLWIRICFNTGPDPEFWWSKIVNFAANKNPIFLNQKFWFIYS